jgi:hypothetical protein
MIIVNQDKDIIANFDNIESVDIVADLDGTGEVPYKIYYETSSKREELGKYQTEERAKEVLQEIVMLFKDEEIFHIRKSTLNNLDELAEPKYILKPISRPKVYEMPAE